MTMPPKTIAPPAHRRRREIAPNAALYPDQTTIHDQLRGLGVARNITRPSTAALNTWLMTFA